MALLDAVDAAVQPLRDMPYRCPLYPALYALKREVRFIPVKNYNIYYVVVEETKTVEIWRVLHQQREQKRL